MNPFDRPLRAVDRLQRGNRVLAVVYAVLKKFGDDQANLLVVGLGWYGFVSIYPMLLVVVAIFGFVGVSSLGTGVENTLQHFPVIGSSINPVNGSPRLHGSVLGLVIGLVGLIYGAQGVTQVAIQAMATVWDVPKVARPGFLPRLARSLLGLFTIGGAFVVSAFVGSLAVSHGHDLVFRVLLIIAAAAANFVFYLAAFKALTPKQVGHLRRFLPGAIFGAVTFTLLTTLGTGLIEHQLRNTSETYGAFASIIGVVTYLLLVAKLSMYGAELNPVLAKKLWPRALVSSSPTEADERVYQDSAREEQRRLDEHIAVGFRGDAQDEESGQAPVEDAKS